MNSWYHKPERHVATNTQGCVQLTFRFCKLIIYDDTVSETDGLPAILPVTSFNCHGREPRPNVRPNVYVMATRIFCACV